jgi:hypothetical protein
MKKRAPAKKAAAKRPATKKAVAKTPQPKAAPPKKTPERGNQGSPRSTWQPPPVKAEGVGWPAFRYPPA